VASATDPVLNRIKLPTPGATVDEGTGESHRSPLPQAVDGNGGGPQLPSDTAVPLLESDRHAAVDQRGRLGKNDARCGARAHGWLWVEIPDW